MTDPINRYAARAVDNPVVRLLAKLLLGVMAWVAIEANGKLNRALDEQAAARAERRVFDSRISRNERDIETLYLQPRSHKHSLKPDHASRVDAQP